ncbi:MAG TPA: 2-amino-4-hydroxy-6-hydroxymethyldihydropteridine diphosphokinase [Methylocystis sp.]|nr:2-amino-4-hydroxy-6-hydroxymethyldihydropteridine diphosphokinase [Methylocystis sp.]
MGATRVGFGIGSNVGDAYANVGAALRLLQEREIARLDAISRIYRTRPWGVTEQEDFANACAIGWTEMSAYALLAAVKRVEADMGRVPSRRWGPRIIDVDILFLGDSILDDPDLTIPHKELFSRAFVLAPLAEIAPDLVLGGVRVGEAAAAADLTGIGPWRADR